VLQANYKLLFLFLCGGRSTLSRVCLFHALVLICGAMATQKMAYANESPPSTNYLGMVGLNTIPTARMDEAGTMRVGAAHTDPHNHAFIGFQVAKPLYVNLRQSMYVSSAGGTPEFVYPGMDIKLRLKDEGRYMPEMVFGMDSVLGHKRFSSEYFALSKRVHDFDFTAGVAWGRLGSAGHLKNPFSVLSSHFERERNYSSEDAASPSDWFTGEDIGFFGGMEYHTPIDGLSLKADFNADAYKAENKVFGFEKPSPWSVGFNYSPRDWVSVGASVIGLDKVMARVSLQSNIFNWKVKSWKDSDAPAVARARPAKTNLDAALKDGQARKIYLGAMTTEDARLTAVLHMNDYQPSAMQVGRAARHLSGYAGPEIESITIIPASGGVGGTAIGFSRRDLEQAVAFSSGSPEEIWQDVEFKDGSLSLAQTAGTRKYKIVPELTFSPGEEETTHLYRSSLLFEEGKKWGYGFRGGTSVRLNVADNLHRLKKFKDVNFTMPRADVGEFAEKRITLNRSYMSWMHTIRPNLHIALTGGYMEEMYAGIGGEILYRPFDSPFAIGGEFWNVFKRDADSTLALGFTGYNALTGHLNLFYDIPDTDITAFAKVGSYIAGDIGVTGGAQMQFDNGMKARAYLTATSAESKDIFGGDRNIIGGFQLAVPLGSIKFIPEGSEARVNFEPMGRDDGAIVDKPLSLYDVTEPMSYRHLGRNWQGVLN